MAGGIVHGRVTYLSLDDLAGSLIDISAYLDSVNGLPGKAARPKTTTFGQRADRYQALGLLDGGPISVAGFFQPSSTIKVHGRSTTVLFDQYALTGDLNSLTIKRMVGVPNTPVFGNTWIPRGVVGLLGGTVSVAGLFTSTASHIHTALMAGLTKDPSSVALPVVTIGLNGFAIGSMVEMLSAGQNSYLNTSGIDAVTAASGDFVADDAVELGVVLHALTAETATGIYATVDETAATAGGGVAHLHVTAWSGTSATFKVTHSADDSTYADLITFTSVTAVGSQRDNTTLSSTAAVNRYLQGKISAASSLTSVTFVMTFARRGYTTSGTYGAGGTHRCWAGLVGIAATQTFKFGPEGSASGSLQYTGEARVQSYDLTAGIDAVTKFAASAIPDGVVSATVF